VRLTRIEEYNTYTLDRAVLAGLSKLGDLILEAEFNITGLRDPEEIEEQHFLDSLSLLSVPGLVKAESIVDIGSGGGLPALVLALALPACAVTAVESQQKKCLHIGAASRALALTNVTVICARAEDYGRGAGRAVYDIAVSRALASLPVVSEYSIPLLRVGGMMAAMKGVVSDQERIQATEALGILGADELDAFRLEPFEGSVNRWAYLARKVRPTPDNYPRRTGMPAKRPLGQGARALSGGSAIQERKGTH
jgi:16S rRNA (guanine527-N7)-methyltransferase